MAYKTPRKTHKWGKDNHCVYCGNYRIQVWDKHKEWNIYLYYDNETGEESIKAGVCMSKQTQLKLV